jgi:sugar lactone lactonase YvrE
MRFGIAAAILAFGGGAARAQTCVDVAVLAGRGVGDGGPGTEAVLVSPRQLAIDGGGNVFIADADNARVRRWDAASGVVTTVAGNGAPGRATEGGPAILSPLRAPSGVAVAGNVLYVADTQNDTVWTVGADGALVRLAGSGIRTGSIDGDRPGQPGNDPTDDLNDGQLAIFATLAQPVRVAIDAAGNVLIADLGNLRIRRVDAATGRIATLVGGLTRPIGIALGPGGTLFIADAGEHRILRLNGASLVPFAGNGTPGNSGDGGDATNAQLNGASDVAVDAAGVVYIGDTLNNVVRKVTTDGKIQRVVGDGNLGFREGPGVFARFNHPGVAVAANGVLVIPDTDNNRVRRYDPSADVASTIVGGPNASGDGGPAVAALLDRPTGLAVGAAGIYVSEHDSHRVRLVVASGEIATVVNQSGTSGSPVDGSIALTAPLRQPTGITLDAAGEVFVADAQDHRVLRIDAAGILHQVAGKVEGGVGVPGLGGENVPAVDAPLNTPLRLAFGPDGALYVTDFNNDRIRRIDAQGRVATAVGTTKGSADGPATTVAQLNQPAGIAFDAAGNLYIADFGNDLVRKVDPAGNVIRIAGAPGVPGDIGEGGPAANARLNGPTDIAIARDGALLVVDQLNNRVRRIAPAADGTLGGGGTITTVVGDGRPSFADGPGPRASLLIPTDVEIDLAGNLLIADRGNHRVRLATPGTSCGVGGGACRVDAECNDGDACTTDACRAGACTNTLLGTPECRPSCDREPNGCIPGGGPRRTDCLAETLVRAPLTIRRGLPQPVVRCQDGDPNCDADTVPGRCTFRVAWCLNQNDPRMRCSASGVGRLTARGAPGDLLVPALLQIAPAGASQAGRSVRFNPPFMTANACTALSDVSVALRRNGRRLGTLRLTTTATGAGRPRRSDTDTVRLVCLPVRR